MIDADHEFALRAAKGDAAAFRLLLERHYDLLYRIAYRFFGSVAEAEDVAQEIALSLASKVRQFRAESRFTTWLYRLALNACRDHSRRIVRGRSVNAAYAVVQSDRMGDWHDSEKRMQWLYQAIDGLDPPLKETVLLVVAEDLSHAEAGEILGVKESTVSWRMHEVRKRLKEMASTIDE
jgi:RNA polymerase sigma-70 factor (ECF subfamily)